MRRRPRTGFTLVEILVSIGIVSVLIGLALPAIQSARAASRSVLCKSNLRQLAQAVHAYHDAHQMIPGWVQVTNSPSAPNSEFSVFSALLPMLDQAAVYDQMNHARGLPAVHVFSPTAWAPNSTVAFAAISVFLCPADVPPSGWKGACNYRGNWGVGPSNWMSAEFLDSGNGFFSGLPAYPRRFAHMVDGLHRTAMFSERVVGDGIGDLPLTLRNIVDAPVGTDQLRDADAILRICAAFSGDSAAVAGVYPFAGKYWLFTGLHQTLYNHSLPPNSAIADCQTITNIAEPMGAAAARSLHPGGVNMALGDGSVIHVSNSISLRAWRAYASRDGGETASE